MFVDFPWSKLRYRTLVRFYWHRKGYEHIRMCSYSEHDVVHYTMTLFFNFEAFVGGLIFAINIDTRASNNKAARKASRDVHFLWSCEDS